MKKTVKTIIALIFLFSLCFFLNTVYAESDFTIKNMDFNAVINKDGSMDVIETWNIRINGETNTLFKTYDLKNSQYSITNVKVTDITSSKDLTQISTEMYHVTTDCYYALNTSSRQFEIAWGVNRDSGERQYVVNYTVQNAATLYNDCAEIYWQFIGKDFSLGADSVTGKITLPDSVSDMDNLRVWAHGPLNGDISRDDSKTVSFVVKPYYSGRYIEVRLAILEPQMFSGVSNVSHRDYFSSILSEEEALANSANRERAAAKAYIWGIVIISAIIGTTFIIFSIKNFKKAKQVNKLEPSIKLDYYRDIPNEKEATPSEAAFLYYYDKGKIKSNMPKVLSSTMLDLALKKLIEFDIRKNEKGKETIYIKVLKTRRCSRTKRK